MRWWFTLFALATGCAPHFENARPTTPPVLEAPAVSIARVSLRYSNVYLLHVNDGPTVLVDAGGPSDIPRMQAALEEVGLAPKDVGLVVLTHGHGDHAGMASFFQKAGAKIVVGRGDELQTTVGHNDEMTPQSPFAVVLKPFVRLDYEPFTPDILVDGELDLTPYGLQGARVRHMPGHTRGSLVVVANRTEALVGDQMLGGIWGGMFHEGSAGDHYYQLEPRRNQCNIQALLDQGIETFYVGHGGPLRRDTVARYAASFEKC